MEPEIIYLIGPPASGKSTFCEKYVSGNNYVIISTDNIIEENAKKWNMTYFQAIMSMKEENTHDRLLLPLIQAVTDHKNIIVDRTNMSFDSRLFTLRYISSSYKRKAVIFNVSTDTLRYRLQRREFFTGKHIPEVVINQMNRKFQFPYGREFNEIKMIYS